MSSTTTTRLGLVKPTAGSGELVNIQTQLNDNWDKLDGVAGLSVVTSETRPGAPWQGQLIGETDTGKLYYHNGSSPASAGWVQIYSAGSGGTLEVAGLTATGAVTAGTLASTGDIDVGNNLAVAGSASITGGADIGGTVNITGATNITVSLNVSGYIYTNSAAFWTYYGPVGPVSLASGFRACVSSTSPSAAIGATETAIFTISDFVFESGRAYKLTAGRMVSHDAVNTAGSMRVRKTNAAGTNWGQLGQSHLGASAGSPLINNAFTAQPTGYLVRTAATDLTADVVLTLQASGGHITQFGSVAEPRFFMIEDCGEAGNYAPLGVDVT